MKIIRGDQVPLSTWSGGTSKQYYIFPEKASYQEKNFLFRLSTASSTSDQESTYTSLPEITRHLIMLEGKIQISHSNENPKTMTPYHEIDVFDGGQKTSAQGICRDFNLMINQRGTGNLQVLRGSQTILLNTFKSQVKYHWLAFYAADQKVQISLSTGEELWLSPDDLLLLEDNSFPETLEIINPTGHLLMIEASLPI